MLRKLDFTDFLKVLKRLDKALSSRPEGQQRIDSVQFRPIGGKDSPTCIAPSFSSDKREWKVKAIQKEGTWAGDCSCQGFTKISKDVETCSPCVHIAGRLLTLPAFLDGALELLGEDLAHEVWDRAAGKTPQTGEPQGDTTKKALETGERPGVETPTTVGEPALHVVWPSALPTLKVCPAAGWGEFDEIQVETTSEYSALGKAVHAVARAIVEQGLDRAPDVLKYCAEEGVEDMVDDVKLLSIFASQAWSGVGDDKGLKIRCPDPTCEEKLVFETLAPNPYGDNIVKFVFRGKADVYSVRPHPTLEGKKKGIVVDWKSGSRANAPLAVEQLKGLGFLVAAQDKEIAEVEVYDVWLRDRVRYRGTFTRDELRDWMLDFFKYSAFWAGKKYKAGPHCTFCQRMATCEGRMQQITALMVPLLQLEPMSTPLLYDEDRQLKPADKIYEAFLAAKTVISNAYSLLDRIKEEIDRRGHLTLESMPGKALGIVLTKGNDTIDTKRSLPVLEKIFTAEEVFQFVSVKKTGLRDAIYNKSEQGKKRANFDALMEKLRLAGAVTTAKPKQKLQLVSAELDASEEGK